MTQTTLPRGKRAELEGLQFDASTMRVGPYQVTDLRDAYTSRSTPETRIVARNYITVTIDISDAQDESRTVDWLSCYLCNRVFPSVAAVESHITSDHANGARRAGAGDVDDLATAGDPVEAPAPADTAVPAQREQEPVDAVEERVPTEPSGTAQQRSAAFMAQARKTRKRWYELQREARREGKRMSKSEAARRMGIDRATLDRRLEATTPRSYNTATPEETRAKYDALIAEHGPLTMRQAAERLGMYPATLSRRLRETEGKPAPAEGKPAPAEEQPPAPAEQPPAAAEEADRPGEEDDAEEDGYVPATGVIDPAREESIDSTVELVIDLQQSRAEWRQRALAAEERAARAERERDEAVAALSKARQALDAVLGG